MAGWILNHEALRVRIDSVHYPQQRCCRKCVGRTGRIMSKEVAGDASNIGLKARLLGRIEHQIAGSVMKFDGRFDSIDRRIDLLVVVIQCEINRTGTLAFEMISSRRYSRYCLR